MMSSWLTLSRTRSSRYLALDSTSKSLQAPSLEQIAITSDTVGLGMPSILHRARR